MIPLFPIEPLDDRALAFPYWERREAGTGEVLVCVGTSCPSCESQGSLLCKLAHVLELLPWVWPPFFTAKPTLKQTLSVSPGATASSCFTYITVPARGGALQHHCGGTDPMVGGPGPSGTSPCLQVCSQQAERWGSPSRTPEAWRSL